MRGLISTTYSFKGTGRHSVTRFSSFIKKIFSSLSMNKKDIANIQELANYLCLFSKL